METHELKSLIIKDKKIKIILESLGMHHIHSKDKYYSCGMPDGDNPTSTIIYKDDLNVKAYTRNIKDEFGYSDIISLASFVKKTYISQTIKYLCDICGYEFYGKLEEKPESLKWLDEIYKMNSNDDNNDDNIILQPINEKILNYYGDYQNNMFENDGISLETQREFEFGYDLESHSITIPIRDELGTLVGIKSRLYKHEISKHESKYFYLHKCAKSRILYGLYKTLPYIKQKGEVLILESEKGVAQLWSNGIRNAVGLGGHQLSKAQVKKLTHLGVNIVFAYDQGIGILDDGKIDKLFYESEFKKFIKNQSFSILFDKNKILKDKESPSDDIEKFKILYNEKINICRKE